MNNTIGVIDLGSNTARLVVYEQEQSGNVTEVDNIKRVIRLSNYVHDGRLDAEGLSKTLACMRQFKQLLDARGVSRIIGIATAAVRQAENRAELLHRIQTETGIVMRVVSGEEEARYGYLAVLHSMDVDEGITIDVGGGSTEITYFQNRRLKERASFPFGIVTLSRMFFHGEQPTEREMEQLRAFLADSYASCPWIADRRCPVIAIGGTARNLAKIHQRSIDYSMGSLHHYILNKEQVTDVLEQLRMLSLEERKEVPGMSKDRADVIISGITVFCSLLDYSQSNQLLVSNKGLRDGVLYEHVWGSLLSVSVGDIRQRSIEQFMNRYHVNKTHAYHVRDLVVALFDQLKVLALHSFGPVERSWLEAAALLHDVGCSIDAYESSEHTFYILSQVLLHGFTHRERLLIAMISSYKNKKQLQSQMALHSDIVQKQEKDLVEKLGHLVVLGRTLDRSMTQPIKTVRLRDENQQIVMECFGKRDDHLEYSLLDDSLLKMSKTWKRPVTFQTITDLDANQL